MGCMINLIYLLGLCFVSVVNICLTMFLTLDDVDDHYVSPLYICILAGLEFLNFCVALPTIGGFTYHQRMVIESDGKCNSQPQSTRSSSITGSNEEIPSKTLERISLLQESSSATKYDNSRCKSKAPNNPNAALKANSSSFSSTGLQWTDLVCDIIPCILLITISLTINYTDQTKFDNAHKYLDVAIALFMIILFIIPRIPLMKKTSLILLQALPEEWDTVEHLWKDIEETFAPEIATIHEVHVWRLTSSITIATLHIVFEDTDNYIRFQTQLHDFLKKFGIDKVTIQPEFANYQEMGKDDSSYSSMSEGLSSSIGDNRIKVTHETDANNIDRSVIERTRKVACLFRCPDETCLSQRCC